MERYEKKNGLCYDKVYDLSAGKSRALETTRITLAIRNTRVEVGQDHHGLCDGVNDDLP